VRSLRIIAATAAGLAAVAIGARSGLVEAAAPPSTSALIAIVSDQEEQAIAESGSRYRYIVVRDVRPQTRDALADLVRRNPQTQVLLYADAGFMVHDRNDPESCDYWPFSGGAVNYCTATKRHEDWFLHDAAGGGARKSTRLRSSGYRASWAADIGDPGYQRTWIRNVKRRLRGRGPDGTRVRVAGVFVDDLNLRPGHGLDGRIAEYTDDAYGQAAVAFGSRIAQELGAKGYVAMANVGMDVANPTDNERLLSLVGAGMRVNREYFVRYDRGDPVFTTPVVGDNGDWLSRLEQFERIQAAGGDYMAMVYGGAPRNGAELAAARYARATFLLGWDGASESALAFRTTDGSNPSDFDAWRTEIGKPTGPRTQMGDRQVWIRHYTGGVALVNADPVEDETVLLDGLYRSGNGVCVPFVVLGPASGRVMPRC
jgi:hypothetical protein